MIEVLEEYFTYKLDNNDLIVNCLKYNDKNYVDLCVLLKDNVDIDQFKVNNTVINISNILRYYDHYKNMKHHDSMCLDFVLCVMDVFMETDPPNYTSILLHTKAIDELKAGMCVIFTDSRLKEQDSVHFAVFLCDNLYLSKFGSGPLSITTEKEINKLYKTDGMYVITKIDIRSNL